MLFRKKKKIQINEEDLKIPNHISFIMDGNGRWAKKRSLPRVAGHNKGAHRLLEISKECLSLGVKNITFYAFSTENWSRPQEEVDHLMKLPIKFFDQYYEEFNKLNMRLVVLGNKSELPNTLQAKIAEVEKETINNDALIVNIAINYGSQDEIIYAVKQLLNDSVKPNDITKELFENYLYTAGQPPVDLMIRTSGEERISNFLLWQHAYAEFIFVNDYWPDFNGSKLRETLLTYSQRDRRFGGVDDE